MDVMSYDELLTKPSILLALKETSILHLFVPHKVVGDKHAQIFLAVRLIKHFQN